MKFLLMLREWWRYWFGGGYVGGANNLSWDECEEIARKFRESECEPNKFARSLNTKDFGEH